MRLAVHMKSIFPDAIKINWMKSDSASEATSMKMANNLQLR